MHFQPRQEPIRCSLMCRQLLAVILLAVATKSLRAVDFNPPAAFLRQYCLDCHNGPDAENAFNIDGLGRDLQRPERMAR